MKKLRKVCRVLFPGDLEGERDRNKKNLIVNKY